MDSGLSCFESSELYEKVQKEKKKRAAKRYKPYNVWREERDKNAKKLKAMQKEINDAIDNAQSLPIPPLDLAKYPHQWVDEAIRDLMTVGWAVYGEYSEDLKNNKTTHIVTIDMPREERERMSSCRKLK